MRTYRFWDLSGTASLDRHRVSLPRHATTSFDVSRATQRRMLFGLKTKTKIQAINLQKKNNKKQKISFYTGQTQGRETEMASLPHNVASVGNRLNGTGAVGTRK